MGVGTTGGSVGVVTAALLSAKSLFSSSSVDSTPVFYSHQQISPQGHAFSEWKTDQDGEEISECQFWNFSHYYAPTSCSPFAVSRISPSTAQKAVQRAIKCAAEHETECLLSGELGFNAPAAFLYDAEQGFRVVLAPKLLPDDAESSSTTKLVRASDPTGQSLSAIFRFNSSVLVEFVTPGSRSVVTQRMTGNDAYCIQALRWSVSPSCWEELD